MIAHLLHVVDEIYKLTINPDDSNDVLFSCDVEIKSGADATQNVSCYMQACELVYSDKPCPDYLEYYANNIRLYRGL